MNRSGMLTILPSLRVRRRGGQIVLTEKFYQGVLEYVRHWGGPVRVLAEETDEADGNLDPRAVDPRELPFGLQIVDYQSPEAQSLLVESAVVLLAMHHRQLELADFCVRAGIPAVFVTEYTLKTRLQILAAQRLNPAVRLRRMAWTLGEEWKYRRAIRRAAGVQCNGTPTFEVYRRLNPEAMLYFDNRVSEEMLATEEQVRKRAEGLLRGAPLRLAFSGRLAAMKGADDLMAVAAELKRLGVAFSMDICGGGELEGFMRREVVEGGLDDAVRFRGVMDYARELMPFMRERVDLFVCCHRQGDPSCTYLETTACGVPIAGYDNEAFQGLAHLSGAGWSSPMNRPERLAGAIAELSRSRMSIVEAGVRSLSFARRHTFEKTFAARLAHLQRLCERRLQARSGKGLAPFPA